MEPLGGHSLSNPVDQTWQALREAVLAHPRISGAKFDHDIKRVDLMTEKTVLPSRRRLTAVVAVDADGTRVVISGAGTKGLSYQVATELLAEVSHRLSPAPAPEDASPSTPSCAAVSDELSEPSVLRAHRWISPDEFVDHEKPHVSSTDRGPRTPPAPPPPPSPPSPPSPPPAAQPPAAPPRPPAAARLAPGPKLRMTPTPDALSELALANDWG